MRKMLQWALLGCMVTLLAGSAWAGGLTIRLNQSIYNPGDTLTVSVSMNKFLIGASTADAYLQVVVPQIGTVDLLAIPSLPIVTIPEIPVFTMVLPDTLPTGSYSFSVILAQVGSTLSTETTLARADVTVTLNGNITIPSSGSYYAAAYSAALAGAMGTGSQLGQPDLSALTSAFSASGRQADFTSYTDGIPGFTLGENGVWTGEAINGATPSLTFFKKGSETPITVDVTNIANYMPMGALFGVNPMNGDLEMVLSIRAGRDFGTYRAEYSLATSRIALTSTTIDPAQPWLLTGIGTLTGAFGQYDATNVQVTVTNLGEQIAGSYAFTIPQNGMSWTGNATFDKNGCLGAEVYDGTEKVGSAIVDAATGQLLFTELATGTVTPVCGLTALQDLLPAQ